MVFFSSFHAPGFFNVPKIHRDPRNKEIPVSFNVFYGSINSCASRSKCERNSNGSRNTSLTSPARSTFSDTSQSCQGTLHYASFKAEVRSDFFSLSSCLEEKHDGPPKSGRGTAHRTSREQKARSVVCQVKEIVFLSAKFNDEILRLWKQATGHGQCAAPSCTNVARGIIHQPLCCSSTGYYGLADGGDLRRLMLAVARQVPELDTEAKVRGAIGASGQDAFVNGLALPVCSTDGRCVKDIRICIANLTKSQRSISLNTEPRLDAMDTSLDYQPTLSIGDHAHIDCIRDISTVRTRKNKPYPFPERAVQSMSGDSLPVRVSVYVGRPTIDPKDEPRENQLSNLVFTASWPLSLFPVNMTSSEALKLYEQICAFHECRILEEGDFCCAICPSAVRATTLLHRPISLRRDNSYGPYTGQLRRTIFNLHRYLRGRWDYPSITASLGNDGVAHINDFVVPLCKRNTICEEVARIAAALFIDRQVPGTYADQILLPALSCDTNLSQGVNSDIDEDRPKCIVKRLGECRLSKDSNPQNRSGSKVDHSLVTIDDLRRCVENSSNWDDVQKWINDYLGVDIVIGGERDTDAQTHVPAKGSSLTGETSAGRASHFTPETCGKRSSSGIGTPASSTSVKQSQCIDSRVYTYTLENDVTELPSDGRPTWGGFPLSGTSLALLKAGAHKVKLILPVISLDLARVMEESLLDENRGGINVDKPTDNTLARRSMYVHERYRKKGVDGEKYAKRPMYESNGDIKEEYS